MTISEIKEAATQLEKLEACEARCRRYQDTPTFLDTPEGEVEIGTDICVGSFDTFDNEPYSIIRMVMINYYVTNIKEIKERLLYLGVTIE